MSPDDERRILNDQLDYLSEKIAALEEQMPSPEELAFLKNEKVSRERAVWAWKKIRDAWPFMTGAGVFGIGVYQFVQWFSKNFKWMGSGP